MFKKILVAFDGLETSMPSALYAINLAKLLNSRLYFLNVISFETLESIKKCLKSKNLKKYCINRKKDLFDNIKKDTGKIGLKGCRFEIIFAKNIEDGINSFVEEEKIDLCISQPSPYHKSEITGDLAKKIAKKIRIPSMFIKTKAEIRKNPIILFPIDEKKENLSGLDIVINLIKKIGGSIIFYHTSWKNEKLCEEEPTKHCDERALKNIEEARKIAEKNNICCKTIIELEATVEGGIIKCAIKNCADLIVMTETSSIIGGNPLLVLENSMYPLMIVKKKGDESK